MIQHSFENGHTLFIKITDMLAYSFAILITSRMTIALQDIDKFAWIASLPLSPLPAPTALDLMDRVGTATEKKALRSREMNSELLNSPSDPSRTKGSNAFEPYALQLVIGKTIREELGEEVAISFCKNIKCGQLVLITGRLGEFYIRNTIARRGLSITLLSYYVSNERFYDIEVQRQV